QGKEIKSLEWIPPVVVDRKNAQGLTELTMAQVFKIDASKLPAYAGVSDSNKGYLLIKVSGVNSTFASDETEKQSAQNELQSALAAEYISAYVGSLRAKNEVSINTQLMSVSSN
ncbi:MAG TPA: peptidylprolyl isomerase, partial [Methylophilaceae bacterium]|nr:peptidylprolyl isomerase [Methylophilaceae bacterium]